MTVQYVEAVFGRGHGEEKWAAALEAVRMIGLNQKEEVRKEWFSDPAQWEMFQKRYHLLADAAKSPVSACPAEPVVSPQ